MIRTLILLIAFFWLPFSHAETAHIATASNFQAAMVDLTAAFQRNHPHQLSQSTASSGVLYNQIIHGAPYDIFLSANARYPEKLSQQNIGLGNTRFTYALGQLVLVSHVAIATDNSAQQLKQQLIKLINNGGRIAIANPKTAPYGIATQQALQTLKQWPLPHKQLIRGSNIGQAFQFVATGNVDIGFAALSQTLHNKTASLYYLPIPQQWYQPIQQQAILLQSGQHNPAALAFLAFLKTGQAKAIIQRHGYKLPRIKD